MVLLYLYGGRVVEWTPPQLPGMEDVEKVEAANTAGHDEFTAIPGIGDVSARALVAAGFHSVDDLVAASDDDLKAVLTGYAFRKLKDWLYVNRS